MKKAHIIIIAAALLVIVSFLYLSDSRKSIFTEKLGDMTLTEYKTGDAAAKDISNMYWLKDIPLAKGYSAIYRSKNATMRIWIAEAPDHNVANDAFNAMNSKLGGSTGHEGHEYSGDVGQTESHQGHGDADTMNDTFTRPEKLDIMEFVKPDVYMMRDTIKADNEYNYYYFKMDYKMGRVYWITFDSPDADYQLSIVKQAVMDI